MFSSDTASISIRRFIFNDTMAHIFVDHQYSQQTDKDKFINNQSIISANL